MSIHRIRRRAALPFALLLGTTAAHAAPATLVALTGLQPGKWEVSGQGVPTRAYCLADLAALFQVRHAQTDCSRLVIANDARTATVNYSCPGAGWGRTSVKQVGSDTLRIDTQGIADNAPFAFTATARRIGTCGTGTALSRR